MLGFAVGQVYIPLQIYGKPLISDVDKIINGYHLIVKNCRVVSWEPVKDAD